MDQKFINCKDCTKCIVVTEAQSILVGRVAWYIVVAKIDSEIKVAKPKESMLF